MFLSRGTRSLHFAARPAVVARHLGLLLFPLAGLTLVPAAVAIVAGEARVGGITVAIAVATAVGGGLLSRLARRATIQGSEALLVVTLVFPLSSLILSVPLLGHGLSFGDAFFESVSAVTTTGLSTIPDLDAYPFPFHFARAWMQWVGGLGVVVLALAMMIRPGKGARRLGFDDRETEDLAGGTRAHARRVLVIYSILTGGGIVLLVLLGASIADAVIHTLAALSTGGFSSHGESLAALPSVPARAGVIVLCFLGALPFALASAGTYRDPRKLVRDPQLIALVVLGALVAIGLRVTAGDRIEGEGAAWGHALATAFSAQSTAGFSTTPIESFGPGGTLILSFSMLIGGGLGSTAGGIKLIRLLFLLALLRRVLELPGTPRGSEVPPQIGRERPGDDEVANAVALVFGYALVLVVSWAIFVAAGTDPFASLFEVSSALGTAGLSAGVTGPELSPLLRGVLCVDMLMGRIEVVGFLLLAFPPTWIGRRRRSS